MDGKITISANTLDEAITKALIELQTTSEHLHYEVVQKESAGLLGIFGKKPCIIRAHVMSEAEEKELAEAKKLEAQKAAEAKKAEAQKAAEAAKKAAQAKEARKTEAVKTKKAEAAPAMKAPVSEKAAAKHEAVAAPETAQEAASEEMPKKASVKINEDAVKKAAKEFLEQVFGAMGMQVSIETVYNASDRELLVSMEGDDMGILIGKRGQTLDSLQYLVSLVVNKETEGYLRVKLDTENYRERRKETLETLAKNISYKVKRTKHPVSLEPMNPYERRIIHSALQNDKYVMTRSEGEDPFRHVVISLKKEVPAGGRKERYGSRRDNRGRNRNAENRAPKAETAAGKKEAAAPTEA